MSVILHRYFGMSLLAVLVTFNGIYTSILTGEFVPTYLESYMKAYLWVAHNLALGNWSITHSSPARWSGAIVIGVNILIFPQSSEKELRQTLVTSLDHIATFLHLLAKTYTLTITDEERKVRDGLNQSIRVSTSFPHSMQSVSHPGVSFRRTLVY